MNKRQKLAFDNPLLFSVRRPEEPYRAVIQNDGITIESFVTLLAPINSVDATWCAEIAAIDRTTKRMSIRSLCGRTQSFLRHYGCELLECVGRNDIRVTELTESVRITRSATDAETELLANHFSARVA